MIPLVGEANEEAIAYVELALKESLAEIRGLIVAERWRKRGIAAALLHVCREVARDRAAKILKIVADLKAKRLQGLYRRLGFTPYRVIVAPSGGYIAPGVHLKQSLE